MKNYIKFFLAVKFLNAGLFAAENDFLENSKNRALSHHNAEEVNLSCDEEKAFKDKAFAIAHKKYCDIWQHGPLSSYRKSECWHVMLMRVRASGALKSLLISKDMENCTNPHYSILINISEEQNNDFKK